MANRAPSPVRSGNADRGQAGIIDLGTLARVVFVLLSIACLVSGVAIWLGGPTHAPCLTFGADDGWPYAAPCLGAANSWLIGTVLVVIGLLVAGLIYVDTRAGVGRHGAG